MYRLVFALALLLSACSGASRGRIAGAYAGSASASPVAMAVVEDDRGHVSGTAEVTRDGVRVGYTVAGMRDGRAYRLAFMSDVSPNLVVRVRPFEGGARLEGTATGGTFVRAPITLARP